MAHSKSLRATLTVFAWILLSWTAGASFADTGTPTPPTPEPLGETPVYEVVPQLKPPSDQCSDRWSQALEGLPHDEKSWRQQLNHGIYRIGIGETLLARVELLSSASPLECEGSDPDWRKRQTQVLVTYFLTDGGTHEVLYEFLEDDVYYNRSPEIYAAGGIVVLQGVHFDGTDVRIQLELELLRDLYHSVKPAPAEPTPSFLMAGVAAPLPTLPS